MTTGSRPPKKEVPERNNRSCAGSSRTGSIEASNRPACAGSLLGVVGDPALHRLQPERRGLLRRGRFESVAPTCTSRAATFALLAVYPIASMRFGRCQTMISMRGRSGLFLSTRLFKLMVHLPSTSRRRCTLRGGELPCRSAPLEPSASLEPG